MALAFHSGFEMGDFSEWSSVVGSPTVQNTRKKTGTYAMRANTSNATAYVSRLLRPERFTSYIYIASAPTGECFILGEDSTFANLRLTTTRYLNLYQADTLKAEGTTQLPLNEWVRISGSIEDTTGYPNYVWINGNIEFDGIDGGDRWGTEGSGYEFDVGVGTAVSADLYFDDIVLDVAYGTTDLGDIRVATVSLPNAVGNYNEFDNPVPSATHYENVDNVPQDPNVDDDYNEIEATGAFKDSYGIENASVIGIGGSDTINAVSTWARMKRNGGSGTDHMMLVRDDGSDYLTADLALNGAFRWFNKYDAVMPNGGGAWTQGRFDALEVGGYRSGAQDQHISNMQVMVAYTVAAAPPAYIPRHGFVNFQIPGIV